VKFYWLFPSASDLLLRHGTFLEGLLCLLEALEPLLPVRRESVKDRVRVPPVEPILPVVDPLRFVKDVVSDLAEVSLVLDELPIALRPLLRGARFEPRPVQGHLAGLDEVGLLAELERLVEQVVDEREAPPTESGEGGEVRMLIRGEPPNGEIFVGGLLEGVEVVMLVEYLRDDPGEMIRGESLSEVGREEQGLIGVVPGEGRTVRARHARP